MRLEVFSCEGGFNPLTEHVSGENVGFLNACGIERVDMQGVVREGGEPAAGGAGEGDGDEAATARGLDGGDHVGAVAGGRDANEDIPGVSESLDLSGKDRLIAVVVRDSGEDGRVRGEGKGGEGEALGAKAADEFGIEMLRIGGTAAIAAPEDFLSGAQSAGDNAGNGLDDWELSFELLYGCEVFREGNMKAAFPNWY